MPRIPESEIERLKRETDLLALARSRGIELRKHGSKDFAGKCPWHRDDKPSFIVSPDKGLFHCMGCGAAGNAIQFVEKFDGVSFRHAYEILNAGKPAFSAPADTPLKQATVPRLDSPLDPNADDATLMRQVVDYYHERLLSPAGKPARDYLERRGLLHDEAIRTFRLGFADRTLGLRLPEINRRDGAAIRARLQSLGIMRETGHEHFSGSVVLPIPDAQGQTVEMYGRKTCDKLRTGTPKHLYLPGPHEGIWNVEALDPSTDSGQSPELILCEAALDALTFWVNGFRNVTFIFGTEGFPDYLFEAILSRRVRRVRIAYDADEAGNRAAARDATRLTAHGVEVFRVKFPWGMDANEYACKVQPAGKALQTVLNAAEWIRDVVGRRPTSPPPEPATPPVAADTSHAPAPAPAPSSLIVANELVAEAADEKKATSETSAISAPPREAIALERIGEYRVLRLGQREYRVGGLEKNNSLDVLKISCRLAVVCSQSENRQPTTDNMKADDIRFHLDSFDMARDGERRRFIERAAEETRLEQDLIKRDLGKLLLLLEQAQQDRLAVAFAPADKPKTPEMSATARDEALALLKAPDLIDRIMAAFPVCGLAGEGLNSISSYLACTSRLLDKPLAVIIQSTSAAGKSTLMEAVLSMFPEEERIKYSAMTGQSLYYLGETNLQHKILAIVEEEGAEKASYALKLLQSEGELTIASTGKDPTTGRMETQEYHVQGPVMLFLTTTAVEIDEELLNRCLILTVDESREQTERIHALQRKARTLEGLRLKKQKQTLVALMRNVQRLLQPLDVMNPWADNLTFTTERTRTRRDHEKYLTLIDAIALLHQYQRPVEHDSGSGDFIRVTLDDIALANRLAPELLGRSLDELPPQTRSLLETTKSLVRTLVKEHAVDRSLALFSRRDLQSVCGWSYSQVKRHLFRLQELEYVAPRVGRMGATLKYELLIDADEPTDVAHIGLLDVDKLRVAAKSKKAENKGKSTTTTTTWTGPEPTLTPHCQDAMTRLSSTLPESCANLVTLPNRASGPPLAAVTS